MEAGKRSGRGDAAEIAAVTGDGEELYRKLTKNRTGKDEGHAPNTLPWLIQSFDQAMEEAAIEPESFSVHRLAEFRRELEESRDIVLRQLEKLEALKVDHEGVAA